MPRQVAMYLTRELTPMSTTRIGEAFGGRDHTTVMHACDKVAGLKSSDSRMRETLDELKLSVRKR